MIDFVYIIHMPVSKNTHDKLQSPHQETIKGGRQKGERQSEFKDKKRRRKGGGSSGKGGGERRVGRKEKSVTLVGTENGGEKVKWRRNRKENDNKNERKRRR